MTNIPLDIVLAMMQSQANDGRLESPRRWSAEAAMRSGLRVAAEFQSLLPSAEVDSVWESFNSLRALGI
jgi:hypothetical protein